MTALTDLTYQVGPIVVGATDTNGVLWAYNPAATTGWYDGPPVRLNQTPIPRYAGAYRANSYRAARTIVITGWVNAPNKAAAQSARDAFMGLFTTGEQETLTVVDGAQTRTMQVELGDAPKATPHAGGIGFDFQLTLIAVDPRKYGIPIPAVTGLPSPSQTGVVWGTPPGSGVGVSWGTPPGSGVGVSWGNLGSAGLVTVSNSGTAESWPTHTIIGPITLPSVTDGAGNVLAWTGPPLSSSDRLVIVTNPLGPRSVTLNGGDQRASLTTTQWAPVAAGASQTYQFQGTSAGSPSLLVSVPPAYW